MRVFACDLADYRKVWESRGWVHIPGALDGAFIEHLRQALHQHRGTDRALRGTGIAGEKGQYRYEPPADQGILSELLEGIGRLRGSDASALTLSERHLKVYDAGADPDPPAHKDRRSSQVSVGISIEVPNGSRLMLYPATDVGENPFLDTSLRRSLESHELPEAILDNAPCVTIEDRPGDLVAFAGSAVWHRRIRSAGTANLYLKVNDFGSDPMGEDPRRVNVPPPPVRRSPERQPMLGARRRIALSPRLEWFGVLQGHGGFEQPMVKLWDESPFPVTAPELEILRAAAGGTSLVVPLAGRVELEPGFERLLRRGAIESC